MNHEIVLLSLYGSTPSVFPAFFRNPALQNKGRLAQVLELALELEPVLILVRAQELAPVLVRAQRMTIREPEQGQEVLKLQVVLAPAHTQVVEREDHTPLELEPELAEE